MKKQIKFIPPLTFFAFAISTIGCSGVQNKSSYSFHSNSSDESEEPSIKEDSYVPVINDFSSMYYWRNNENEIRFGAAITNNSGPSLEAFVRMQSLENCSLETLKTALKGKDFSNKKIYEISYPMSALDVAAFDQMSYHSFPSRNIDIYRDLGLLDSYEHFYGGSNQIYCELSPYFKEESKFLDVYSKHFTNLSHIYVWENEDFTYSCGISSQIDGEVVDLTPIRFFQDSIPSSLDDMKKIIEMYYDLVDVEVGNLIVEIPFPVNTARIWADSVRDLFPNNVSSNKKLYEQLGLLDVYKRLYE